MQSVPLGDDALALVHRFLTQTKEHAFICLDPQGRVIGWSLGAYAIFGYAAAEALGRPLGDLLFTPEDHAKGLDAHELEVARRDSRSEDDRWHVRKDGTRIWATGSVQAVRDDQGQLLGFVKVVRDRTDLHTWTSGLENEVERLRSTYERTLRFLRTLGHEMRNPMAPLQNSAFILQRLHADEKTAKVVEIIQSQVSALRRLAEDLMDVARLEGGTVGLALVRTDLREAVLRAANGLQGEARAKRLRLEAIVPHGALPVRTDPDRFQQVLANLLGNALKYTPEGGTVWIKATQEGREIVLRVEDTGIGIEPTVLPRIFDLFSRDAGARDLDPHGLGIGLSVVREIVQLHGGSVQARSAGPGKGAEFTVRLPVADADDGEDLDSPSPMPPPPDGS